MNGILMYKGKYGATRQYAEWIGEALQWPVHTPEEVTVQALDAADTMVIGSSVYEGRLQLHSWLKQHVHQLKQKQLFLFIVCGTPPDKKDVLDEIASQNIPPEIRERCTICFLRGRVVIKDLNWIDKLMLKFAARVTKDPDEKQRMIYGFDALKRENVLPLINAVKALQTKQPGLATGKEIFADGIAGT